MNETELAEYAREKGLFVEQIKAWRDACMSANGGLAQETARMKKKLKEGEKERKKLERELIRKERALAEAAALLVPSKKSKRSGGARGRMISATDRVHAVELIDEAVAADARRYKACRLLCISDRTYCRWMKQYQTYGSYDDLQLEAVRPEPVNKLTPEERQEILTIMNRPEYSSLPPSQMVPALADQGIYLASESTFYRVLREHNQQHHRGRAAEPNQRSVTTHAATAPNQVYMWNITCLNGPIKGSFYYLDLISDLFSRDIVGWEAWEEESAAHASELLHRTCLA